jgi:hypothetical protein
VGKTSTQVAAEEPDLGVKSRTESVTARDVQRPVMPRCPIESVVGSLEAKKVRGGGGGNAGWQWSRGDQDALSSMAAQHSSARHHHLHMTRA